MLFRYCYVDLFIELRGRRFRDSTHQMEFQLQLQQKKRKVISPKVMNHLTIIHFILYFVVLFK